MLLESEVPVTILLLCSRQEELSPEAKTVAVEIMRNMWMRSDFEGKMKMIWELVSCGSEERSRGNLAGFWVGGGHLT